MKTIGMFLVSIALALVVGVSMIATPPAHAQEQALVYPYGASVPSDPELKNLEWNRYTAGNFTILSIDNTQGKWLNDNIDKIKSWCLTRWGFPDVALTRECRMFCVPNKALLKKLFALEGPKAEIRKDMTVIWLSLDEAPAKSIPPQLTLIALAEFEAKYNVSIGWWFKRGSAQLNGTVPEIRVSVAGLADMLKKDQPLYVSEKMFTMTEEDYMKETAENRATFDRQAVALCIMLRKEFGEAKLQGFLRISSRNNSQDVLKVVYGFSGYSHFDKQYIRFMRDLTSDVLNNKTPDSYLEIRPVR